MSEFKEIIQKYAGVINEENETYSGRAIKFSDAINRLVNLGIPREKAVIAVKQAITDKSKINQIANKICCECADSIESVLEENNEDDVAALEIAKAKAKEAKKNAYNAAREAKIKAKLGKRTEKYNKQAEYFANNKHAVRNEKIKKTIAAILMAAALGGAGAVAGNKYVANEREKSYANGVEGGKAFYRQGAYSREKEDFAHQTSLNHGGKIEDYTDDEWKKIDGYDDDIKNTEKDHAKSVDKEVSSFGHKVPILRRIKDKAYKDGERDTLKKLDY